MTNFSELKGEQLENLLACMATCRACCNKCIEEGNKKTAAVTSECADACDLAIKWKCCNGNFTNQALELCAQVCKKCADECGHAQSEHCKECADICTRCSNSCSTSRAR
jgi:hypothetical protein